MNGWGGKVWSRVKEQGAGSVPGAIPPAAIPGALHTLPSPLCFCTETVFWEAGEGKPAAGLPGIKSLLLTIAQDYFEAR